MNQEDYSLSSLFVELKKETELIKNRLLRAEAALAIDCKSNIHTSRPNEAINYNCRLRDFSVGDRVSHLETGNEFNIISINGADIECHSAGKKTIVFKFFRLKKMGPK